MCLSSPSEVFDWAWGRGFFTAVVASWTVHVYKEVEKLPARTGIKITLLYHTVKMHTT
jgi:hypothetical protein